MATDIELRQLGKTDLRVSPIGLGAMQFSEGKGMMRFVLGAIPIETTNAIVEIALNSGMNWIDTAEVYGSGASECAVARALNAMGSKVGDMLIATKWLPIMRRAKSIAKSAEKSTNRLNPFPIDLYQVHQPFSLSSLESQMDAMADLVDGGIVRAIGVSNYSADKMVAAHEALAEREIPLASNQVRVSLLDRRIDNNGVFETAKELGVTIIAYTPLGQGVLTGKLHRNPELLNNMPRMRRRMLRRYMGKSQRLVEELESVAESHDATPAQISLSWLINFYGEIVVAIPGSSKTIQAEQNAGAMRVRLTSEEQNALSDLSLEIT